MSDSPNKTWYIIAGGAVLIGAALAFHSMSGSSAAGNSDQMLEEIGQLGEPKRDQNGMLTFHYYKELFLIVNKHVKDKNAANKVELVQERREALKAGDLNKYKQIVQDIIQQEEKGFQDTMGEAMECIGLSENEFMQVHQTYSQHPSFQQTMMQAQFDSKKKPSIEREKAKRIFLVSEEKKMKQMGQMMQNPNAQQQDPIQAMMEVMVESCKLNDEIFFEHGIEEDEFNAAVIFYNLQEDPEVRAMLMRNMQAMGMGG